MACNDYEDSKLKLHFARHRATNEWVSVFDAPVGENTNCVCPVCKKPVGAKNRGKGENIPLLKNQRTAHFYHLKDSDCKSNGESVFHVVAKEILLKTKRLFVPTSHRGFEHLVGSSLLIEFDEVLLEKRIDFEDGFIIADAVGLVNGKKLLIEFAVTSFSKTHKVDQLRLTKMDCLEININSALEDLDVNDIQMIYSHIANYLISQDKMKSEWLHNKRFLDNLPQIKIEAEMKRENVIARINELQAEIDKLKSDNWLTQDDFR